MQKFLNAVREGAILYLGINHNIGEHGSLKHELTLYLDTEILFDLLGYNGSVYETLSKDFYKLVQKGRRNGKITLTYFPHVKSEIERFFKSAEIIVEGRGYFNDEKPAMKHIFFLDIFGSFNPLARDTENASIASPAPNIEFFTKKPAFIISLL